MIVQLLIDKKDNRVVAYGVGKASYSQDGTQTVEMEISESDLWKFDRGYEVKLKDKKLQFVKTDKVMQWEQKRGRFRTLKEKAKNKTMTLEEVQAFIDEFC